MGWFSKSSGDFFLSTVVPQGQARIRTQVCAAHTRDDLDFVVEKFAEVSKELALT